MTDRFQPPPQHPTYICVACGEQFREDDFNADKGMCKKCASQLCHICRHLSIDVEKCDYCKELTCCDCVTDDENTWECTECEEIDE